MINDFRDMLFALSEEKAEFLVVGAYALAYHGLPRATGDLDILVRPSVENAAKVWRGLLRFGAPLSNITEQELAQPDLIFQIGVAPSRIDIITEIDGVDFAAAAKDHITIYVDNRPIPVMGIDALLINKLASGRPKDLADVAWIREKLKNEKLP